MAEVKSVRRYYLHKRLEADSDLAATWQAKQEAEPGTDLPEDFPSLSDLAAVGYTTVEDLDGADSNELVLIGLTSTNASKVLTALEALL